MLYLTQELSPMEGNQDFTMMLRLGSGMWIEWMVYASTESWWLPNNGKNGTKLLLWYFV